MITITDKNTNEQITFEPMTRESYMAQRAAWKAEYARLSGEIRKAKLEIKAANRAGEYNRISGLIMTREILRDYARAALEERRILKLKAQASYEYAREVALAA